MNGKLPREVILAIEGYDELLAENPYLKASLTTVCLTLISSTISSWS